MMFVAAALFVLVFVLLMPQCQAFLHASAEGAAAFITAWAPFSYVLMALLLIGPLAAIYLMHTWPKHVEPENPMAKYRRETPSADDD